jgi:predicted methyltransferase
MMTKGAISGRPFEPSRAGGKILNLSYTKAKITDKGTDIVEAHIRRFNPIGDEEIKMVERLRKIAVGKLVAEPVYLRFYTHEIREYLRYKKLGYPTGQPDDPDAAYELWNNAHTATLEDYGLKERPGVLFKLSS